jgi:hypothetical protein
LTNLKIHITYTPSLTQMEFTMATKKMNPFKGPETKKNEAAEKKMTKGNPKAYAAMEKKYEKEMPKKGMKKY